MKTKYDQFITKIIPIFNSQQLKDKLGDGLYKKIEDLFRKHRRLRHKYFNILTSGLQMKRLKFINRILAKKADLTEITNEDGKGQIRIFTDFVEEKLSNLTNLIIMLL